MEIVSFKVAKAIKEAGYPQIATGYTEEGYKVNPFIRSNEKTVYSAPTYIDVWLWLWREKNINIKDSRDGAIWIWVGDNPSIYLQVSRDPEEAIIASIEYLANNDLIK